MLRQTQPGRAGRGGQDREIAALTLRLHATLVEARAGRGRAGIGTAAAGDYEFEALGPAGVQPNFRRDRARGRGAALGLRAIRVYFDKGSGGQA